MAVDLQYYIPLILTLLIALTFHEFAHAWVAYKLGDDTAYHEGRVTLNPIVHLDPMGAIAILVTGMFGWAKPVPVNPRNFAHPRRDDILVTIAGPLSNLLLGIIAAFIFVLVFKGKALPADASPMIDLSYRTLKVMIQLNFMLMFFNFIPVSPLDGSHIVTNLLPLNEAYQFKRFNQQYGMWVLLGLILVGPLTQHKIAPLYYLITKPTFFLTNQVLHIMQSLLL